MTISEGYPDWQRVQTHAYNPFYNVTQDTGGVEKSTGLLYVANFPVITMLITATGTSVYNIEMQWYSDSDKVNALLVEQIGVGAGVGPYRNAHGVISPWVIVFITPVTYVAGDTVHLELVPNTIRVPATQLSYPYLVRQTNLSINAGATQTDNSNAIVPGPGILNFHSAASTSHTVHFQALEADGNWYDAFTYSATVTPDTQVFQVTLPPRPTRLQVTNNGAAAHQYVYSLSSWAP